MFVDFRHALRLLVRSPLFTATAVLSLAIGIGATTTVFTLADALLLRRPVGVTDPDRVVDIGRTASYLRPVAVSMLRPQCGLTAKRQTGIEPRGPSRRHVRSDERDGAEEQWDRDEGDWIRRPDADARGQGYWTGL